MYSERINYAAICSRLAAFSLLLAGCEGPPPTDLGTLQPNRGVQASQVEVVLTGRYFSEKHEVFIDGVPGASASEVTLVGLTRESSTILRATLRIEPTAPIRAYHLTLVNRVDDPRSITSPRSFYVTCGDCQPPELLGVATEGHATLIPLPGVERLRVIGRNLIGYQPQVFVPGSYSEVENDRLEVEVDPATNLDVLRIRIGVGASGGNRELFVRTTDGTSNSLELFVKGYRGSRPHIRSVATSNSYSDDCLRPGSNVLTISGYGFDESTGLVARFVSGSRAYSIQGVETELISPETIRTRIEIPADVLVDAGAAIEADGTAGRSDPHDLCASPGRPTIRHLTPDRVTQGTTVFVRCYGEGLESGVVLAEEGQGVTVEEVLDPVEGGAVGRSRVARLRIDATARGLAAIWIRDAAGTATNIKTLEIVPPVDAWIQSVSPDFVGRGTAGVDVEVKGRGLVVAGQISFSNPQVEISNVRIDPSYESMTFHVRAAADAPLTNDAATNLIAGNPLAFRIIPPNATPTPTPSSGGPVITNITPVHIGKGVEVLIKCEGSGFGMSRQVITDPPLQTTTYGVASAAADPDRVVVAKLFAGTPGPVKIRVRNLIQQTTSAEFTLFVDEPAPGVPVARGATGDGVHRGGGFDLAVYGNNLEGITDSSWSGIPGLTFSNTTYSSSTATVHIEADGSAPLTADEATNLRITTAAGQSPPFLFRVFQ